MHRRQLAPWIAAAGLCAGARVLAESAPHRPGPATVGQKVAVGDLSAQLRRVAFRRTAAFDYHASGRPASRPSASAEADLEFAFGARDHAAVDRLVPGPASGTFGGAGDDGGRSTDRVTARVEETDAGFRLLVHVKGLSPHTTRLASLDVQVQAYPNARRVRFHIPWLKDATPLSVEFGGGKATLRRFQLVEDDSTLWVAIHPPAGYHVAPAERPHALRARAVDIYGNLVNGGGITETRRVAGGDEPEFRFFAPGLTRVPSRLMLDVLCVSGEPRPLLFRFGDLALPATD